MDSRSFFAIAVTPVCHEASSHEPSYCKIATTKRIQLSIFLIVILLSDRCFPSLSFATSNSIFAAPSETKRARKRTASSANLSYLLNRKKLGRNYFCSGVSCRDNKYFHTETFVARTAGGILQDSSSSVTKDSIHNTKRPNWNIVKNMGSVNDENENGQDSTNNGDSAIQNAAAEETHQLLQERCLWSESQYLESLELYDKFVSCTDSYIETGIKNALDCLDHAYRLYGPESVLCSFNGGKDAVVVLNLVRAAHAHYYHTKYQSKFQKKGRIIPRPRVIYFDHEDEFPQLTSYLHDRVNTYDLDMICFDKGIKFQDGLKILVDNNFPMIVNKEQGSLSSLTSLNGKNNDYTDIPPFPMAFVLGTRATDPNAGNQGQFAPSSHFMPPFMRVNPILDWSYGLVWHFLRLFHLPYCQLYDQGYTSLGTTKDTLPCPALAIPGAIPTSSTKVTASNNSSGLPKYWPAYMLRDWNQERAGRLKKQKKKNHENSTIEAKEQPAKSIHIDGDKETLETFNCTTY